MSNPKKTIKEIEALIEAYEITKNDFIIEGMFGEAEDWSDSILVLEKELKTLKNTNNGKS